MSDFDAVEEFLEDLRAFTRADAGDTPQSGAQADAVVCGCGGHADSDPDTDDDPLPKLDDDDDDDGRCVCGFPDREDGSLAHILAHNAGEVAGAVTVDWSRAHGDGDHPVPYLIVVKDVATGARLYPARLTILSDAAATLAVVDVTELVNADGEPIRSTTQGKMGVHTPEYKAWNNQEHAEGDVFLGDKYVTVTNRFVLAAAR